jgi:hypothetical protein
LKAIDSELNIDKIEPIKSEIIKEDKKYFQADLSL